MELPEFRILDLIDIVLVAAIIYYIYRLVKGTPAIKIFIGIVIIYLIYSITSTLKMELLSRAFDAFAGAGIIIIIVVFQQEIRKFLLILGSTNFTSRSGFIKQLRRIKDQDDTNHQVVSDIVTSCELMAQTKTGALIVIKRDGSLNFLKHSGDRQDIKVNCAIIQSIFFKNSPLHDGAMIIEGNKITATRVILPVSDNTSIPQRFGLRHRAAVGITERSDAIALTVSEETGQIALINNGVFESFDQSIDLQNKLIHYLE